MDNKSKLFLAFGAGALLGAALVALATSDTGKQVLGDLKDKMKDLPDEIKKKVNDLENEISDFFKEETSKENPVA